MKNETLQEYKTQTSTRIQGDESPRQEKRMNLTNSGILLQQEVEVSKEEQMVGNHQEHFLRRQGEDREKTIKRQTGKDRLVRTDDVDKSCIFFFYYYFSRMKTNCCKCRLDFCFSYKRMTEQKHGNCQECHEKKGRKGKKRTKL